MSKLSRDEYAILELLALQPLSCIPPMHRRMIDLLLERGLTVHFNSKWYPTASALKIVGRTLH